MTPSPIPTSQLLTTLLHTSNLFLTQLCTSLISIDVIQVAFILSLIFLLFSIFSCHLCPVHHFDHLLFYSLIILCTLCIFSPFFVFACEYPLHVNSLCLATILHFPPLNIACDILCISFYSYLRCYDYSIHVQLHIYSHSFVLSSSACN